MMMQVQIKRIYEKAESKDGTRILVDKLWPRGISKQEAKIDGWWKEAAPSPQLRKWFHHAPDRWDEFKELYKRELHSKKETIVELISKLDEDKPLTLLYGAKDKKHNHAKVLKQFIEESIQSG